MKKEEATKRVVDYFREKQMVAFCILVRGWNVPTTLAVNFLMTFKNMNMGCEVTVIAYFTKSIAFLLYFPLIFVFGSIIIMGFLIHSLKEMTIFIEMAGWFGFLTCCLWATLKIYSYSLVKRLFGEFKDK